MSGLLWPSAVGSENGHCNARQAGDLIGKFQAYASPQDCYAVNMHYKNYEVSKIRAQKRSSEAR
jgi:hypothetical protein